MSTDLKTAFYFRHRALIEEWSALRKPAQTSFDTSLRGLGGRFALIAQATGAQPFEWEDGAWCKVGLTKPVWNRDGWQMAMALGWNSRKLLDPTGTDRPYLGVALLGGTTRRAERSSLVRGTILATAEPLGWTDKQQDAWPVSGWVDQPSDDNSLDAWVEACAVAFEQGWAALHERLDEAVSAPE